MDLNISSNLLLGTGLSAAFLLCVYGILLACAWIIVIIRVAINEALPNSYKILWILGNIFFPVISMFYFMTVERNIFLKICGWFMLLFSIAICYGAIYLGYRALQNGTIDGMGQALVSSPVVPETQQQAVTPAPAPPPVSVPPPSAPIANGDLKDMLRPKAPSEMDGDMAIAIVGVEQDPGTRRGIYEAGMKDFNKKLAEDPKDVNALVGRATLKEIMMSGNGAEDYKAVQSLLDEKIKQSPDKPELYLIRSRAYSGLKQYKEARDSIQKAVDLAPDNQSYKNILKALDQKLSGELDQLN